MRSREEIKQSPKSFEALALEVLLDIRDLLGESIKPMGQEAVLPILECQTGKKRVKRKYTRRKTRIKAL